MPESYRAIYIGESIEDGRYQEIFSSHAKAVNLIWKRQVISVCNRTICPGPFRLILDLDDVSHIRSFNQEQGLLQVNCEPCVTKGMEVYQVLDFSRELPDAERELKVADLNLPPRCYPPQSVGYLLALGPQLEKSFDGTLGNQYKKGLALIGCGDIKAGLHCFKGKGYGLTPGGDDFLAGFMLGLSWKERAQKKSLSEIKDLLLCESLSENYLSNTFLLQAYHLKPDRDWADFLLALETQTNPQAAMLKITSHGATSGYDTLSGFFAAWEIL